MAEIQGAVIPESDAETEFMIGVNQLAKDAYDEGVEVEDLATALNFISASMLKRSEPSEETPDPPEPPEKAEECPECDETIANIQFALGGHGIVEPCGCRVHADDVDGWGEADGRFDE